MICARSDLTPTEDGYVEITFEYPDETTLLKGNNLNGPVVLADGRPAKPPSPTRS
jgi:hypothetical protein